MDSSGEPGSYPFAPAELDIDMMDKVRTGVNGSTGSRQTAVPPGPAATPPLGAEAADPAQLAQQVSTIVQGLAARVRDLELQRQVLAQKAATNEQAARESDVLRQTLRETVSGTTISAEDLETMQRVLAALARDPNHIMVLASVAQQAGKLTAIVESYIRLRQALQQ